jgi:hypothetical protein
VFKKGLVRQMNNLQEWLKEVVINRQHVSASADEITITMRGKPNPHRSAANDQAILNLVNDGLGLPHRTLRASNLSLVLPTLLLICVSAFSSGCAVRQPKLSHPVAQYSIPLSCLDGVAAGTKATHCEALPKVPGQPDQATCDHIIVNYHCTKVVQ